MKTRPEKVFLLRLGCPKAEIDHAYLRAGLEEGGVEFVENAEDATTVVVSTCAFLDDARKESIDAILDAVRWKGEDSGRRVYMTGCMPARYEKELTQELPEVDGFFPFSKWQTVIDEIRTGKKASTASTRISHDGQIPVSLVEKLAQRPSVRENVFRYLKIAEGCNRRCAYCAIPTIRGSYTSRRPEDLLRETGKLLSEGYRELIVIAEEINSYGRDLRPKSSIEELLPEMGALVAAKDSWLRILYTHPPLFSEDFIAALKHTPGLVPYIDFPIEHADDHVLKAMGRGTTWKQMRHWMERMREEIPGIAIRTSVIVGHPGETVRAFQTLLERIEEAAFDRIGIFRYSREEGTRAADRRAPSKKEARRREEILRGLGEEMMENWYMQRIGYDASVIIENVDENGVAWGRSEWDAPEIDGEAQVTGNARVGEIVKGVVTASEPYLLTVDPERGLPSESA